MADQVIMTINLRRAMEKGPSYKKSSSAAKFVRSFVSKHMKAKEVSIDNEVNNQIFSKGSKNPPTRVRVLCSKDSNGKVSVKLVGSSSAKKE